MDNIEAKRLKKASLEKVVICNTIGVKNSVGGSASVKIDTNGLPFMCGDLSNKVSKNSGNIKCVVLIEFSDYMAGEIIYLPKCQFMNLEPKGFVAKFKMETKLNKSKVRSKIYAYAQLKKSQIFLAFYSISFPANLSDEIIRKIHNTALTRIRKLRPSFSYIWVAERQKNGTLHFHMLTNEYFNVRIINHIYAKAIQNQIAKLKDHDINFDYKKYNGVDVKRVKNVKGLAMYLSKYITKNNEVFQGLSWNCDSSVSSLVTHLYLSDDDWMKISKKMIYITSFTKHHENIQFTHEFDIYDYGSYRPKIIFETILMINEYSMKTFFKKI